MTDWTARVEWHTPDGYDIDGDALAFVLDNLAGYSPAVSSESTDREIWSATISLSAPTLLEAVAEFVRVVEGATGEKVTGMEILSDDDFDTRHDIPAARAWLDSL